jgi:hypothetical protein
VTRLLYFLILIDTSIRRVFVDNSMTRVTFWTGSNHGAAIIKVELLDWSPESRGLPDPRLYDFDAEKFHHGREIHQADTTGKFHETAGSRLGSKSGPST